MSGLLAKACLPHPSSSSCNAPLSNGWSLLDLSFPLEMHMRGKLFPGLLWPRLPAGVTSANLIVLSLSHAGGFASNSTTHWKGVKLPVVAAKKWRINLGWPGVSEGIWHQRNCHLHTLCMVFHFLLSDSYLHILKYWAMSKQSFLVNDPILP